MSEKGFASVGRRLTWGGRFSDLLQHSLDGWTINDAALASALRTAPEVVVLDALSFPWEVYMEAGPDVPLVIVLPAQLGGDEIASVLGPPILRDLTPFDRLVDPRPDVRSLLERRFGLDESLWLPTSGPTFADSITAVADYCNRRLRSVDADIGTFMAHEDDVVTRHLIMHGAHQRGTLDAVLSLVQPGDSVLDVGAHIGTFSVPLGHSVGPDGRVVAVEPVPENASLLRTNIAANELGDRITVITRPVGAQQGHRFRPVQESGNSGATRLVDSRGTATEVAETDTIDSIVAATQLEPTLIKLDVEGAELAALRGAANTVERFRPRLVMEVSGPQLHAFGDSPAKLDRWLEDHDYEVFRVAGERNGRHPEWHLKPVQRPLVRIHRDLFDIVASPRETAGSA